MPQDFENQNNFTQVPVQRVFNDENQNVPQDNMSDFDNDNLHYMPERFMAPSQIKNSGKNGLMTMIIVLIFIVVLAVAGFVAYVYFGKKNNTPNNNNNILNLPQGQSTTTQQIDNTNNLKTALDRDKKRIDDIFKISSALALYFKDNGRYPNSLNALSQYIKEIPENPSPGGETYFYQPLSSSSDYILVFILEEGGDSNGIILRSGKYQFTPKFGLEPYKEETLDLNKPETTNNTNNNEENALPIIPPKGADFDNDGLTDVEEALFSTNRESADTDADSYTDANELKNLYDPTKPGEKLVNNVNLVRVYNDEENQYSLMYPAKWLTEEDSTDPTSITFYQEQGKDFFKIQIKDNPQGMSLRSWYLNYSPSSNTNDLQTFTTKNGDTGIKSKDNLSVFLSHNNKIYIISYIVVNTDTLDYFSTFETFVQSFKFTNKNS